MLSFFVLSCASDDELVSITEENSISFHLNGVAYFITEYDVGIDPTDSNMRMIEAVFDNDTKKISFFVIVEETNEIERFVLEEHGVSWISEFGLGYRDTSITTHTDSKMEGTFNIIMEDRNGQPLHIFINGVINIGF
ncbi:hypothetical protein KORDIASMS9_01353 [Kordia sp. SMS9]|nr:hypothetical protein KORDIASMS9_01353 [Kordia sp. SMS9]